MVNRSTINKLLTLLGVIMILAGACKKGDDPDPVNNPPVVTPPDPTLEDTISRKWEITQATHNGTDDFSSMGMQITINKNGTYILHKTNYNGTWEFLENKTKVLLDKATPEYKTTWTIEILSSKRLKVSFKSPFTGGSVVWDMKSI